MKMTTGNAMEMLGLLGSAVAELRRDDVMRAFRKAMLAAHPDTAASGEATPERVTNLLQAKKTLLDAIAGRNSPCAQCRGRGRVPHGIGTAVCGACKGTGDATP